jgi:hypothetical protein
MGGYPTDGLLHKPLTNPPPLARSTHNERANTGKTAWDHNGDVFGGGFDLDQVSTNDLPRLLSHEKMFLRVVDPTPDVGS